MCVLNELAYIAKLQKTSVGWDLVVLKKTVSECARDCILACCVGSGFKLSFFMAQPTEKMLLPQE